MALINNPPSSAISLVSTQDASSSTQIPFTGLQSGYSYFCVVTGYYQSGTSGLGLEYSINDGSSYTEATYKGMSNSSSTTWGSSTNSMIPDHANFTNSSDPVNVVIELGNLGSTSTEKTASTSNASGDGGGTPYILLASANLSTTSAINAIKFTNRGGGTFTGKFSLYRRKLT